MGLLGKLFGGKTKQTSSVDVPEEYQNFLNRNLNLAQDAFSGFQGYDAQRIADFSDDELSSFGLVRDRVLGDGLAQQLENQALSRFLGAPTQRDLQPFTNPFADEVIDRSAQRVYDAYDTEIANIRNQAADMGAFGGSRFAVAESNALENLGQTVGDLAYRGEMDNFNQAMDRYYGTALQGLGAAGQADQQGFNRANQLLGIGQNQRALEQAGLDFDFSEFMRSVDTPRQDAMALSNIAANYPRDIFTRTETQQKTPGLFNAVAGLAGTAIGAATGTGGLGSIFGGGSGGGGGSASGFSNIGGGFSGGASPSLQAIGYQPGSFTNSLGASFGGGYAEGGEVRIPLSDDEQNQIQNWYDNQRSEKSKVRIPLSDDEQQFVQNYYDGLFDRVPTPRQKPPSSPNRNKNVPKTPFTDPSDGPVQMQVTNPFIEQKSGQTEEKKDNRDFMDRWLDNPFTQFGLTMLAGTDTDLGRSANMLLDQRSQELNQEREDMLIEQQRQQALEDMARREAMAQAELNARLADSQKDRELREKLAQQELAATYARIAASKDTSTQSTKDNRLDIVKEAYKDLRSQEDAIARQLASLTMSNPDDRARMIELERQQEQVAMKRKMAEKNLQLLAPDLDILSEEVEDVSDAAPSDPLGLLE